MKPTTVVDALVAGSKAVAKAGASETAKDLYARLKATIASNLGRAKAIEALEEAPDSPSAWAALKGALSETGADRDEEVGRLASELITAL
jgi:hypothetical protein